MTSSRTNYDSPWKGVIETFFPSFLEFFFPDAYDEIDWTQPYEFLDQELEQLQPDAEIGKRLVDKVVKVWLKDGKQGWVLVHVEVQAYQDDGLPERVYVYNYRLYDRHRKEVMSLVILADDDEKWRPTRFGYSRGGSRTGIDFCTNKLLDYSKKMKLLEKTTNPCGIVVLAHLKTKATNQNPESRLHWKLTLARMLFAKGYNREYVRGLFKFVDWIMKLPDELQSNFQQELRKDEEVKMEFVSVLDELVEEHAQKKEVRESLIEVLEVRFGSVTNSIVELLSQVKDISELKTLRRRAITISSVAEFEELLSEITTQA